MYVVYIVEERNHPTNLMFYINAMQVHARHAGKQKANSFLMPAMHVAKCQRITSEQNAVCGVWLSLCAHASASCMPCFPLPATKDVFFFLNSLFPNSVTTEGDRLRHGYCLQAKELRRV